MDQQSATERRASGGNGIKKPPPVQGEVVSQTKQYQLALSLRIQFAKKVEGINAVVVSIGPFDAQALAAYQFEFLRFPRSLNCFGAEHVQP